MAKDGQIEIVFNHEAFASYRRLAYKWWYAIAEFVDNSTQSYFDNQADLDEELDSENEVFKVSIVTDNDLIRISDNAMGMDLEDLERAMVVGRPPENPDGRSRYGLGMKTAACWIGNLWTIRTSKLGSAKEYTVHMDVEKIIKGDMIPKTTSKDVEASQHYTIIEIKKHNHQLKGRTISKVKEYLASIYRRDLTGGDLYLTYNDDPLKWEEFKDEDFLKQKASGEPYRKSFIFELEDEKVAEGWVGVLEKGSRAKAGFSILHRGRVIKGYPDSWKPADIYGDVGRNDLINQRLVGEINLEEFEVSHTKDEINWQGDEEDRVGTKLKEECRDYIEVARKTRKKPGHGPKPLDIASAMAGLKDELEGAQLLDKLELTSIIPSQEHIQSTNKSVIKHAKEQASAFVVNISNMTVTIYLDSSSPNDPYFLYEIANDNNLNVLINIQHPHWFMLEGENSVLNYLKHCVYDALAEFQASKVSRLDSDTVKIIKDDYLRVAFEVVQND